jgi:hypothetical protein
MSSDRVDVEVHCRGKGEEQSSFLALPHVGDLLDLGGQGLRRVVVVKFGATIDVYTVSAAAELAGELTGWDTPAEAEVDPAQTEAKPQAELFP